MALHYQCLMPVQVCSKVGPPKTKVSFDKAAAATNLKGKPSKLCLAGKCWTSSTGEFSARHVEIHSTDIDQKDHASSRSTQTAMRVRKISAGDTQGGHSRAQIVPGQIASSLSDDQQHRLELDESKMRLEDEQQIAQIETDARESTRETNGVMKEAPHLIHEAGHKICPQEGIQISQSSICLLSANRDEDPHVRPAKQSGTALTRWLGLGRSKCHQSKSDTQCKSDVSDGPVEKRASSSFQLIPTHLVDTRTKSSPLTLNEQRTDEGHSFRFPQNTEEGNLI